MDWQFWKKLTPAERAEVRAKGLDGPDEGVIADVDAQVQAEVERQVGAERAAMRAALRKEQAARLETEASAFVEGELRAGRALPAERPALGAAYIQAALDDAEHGVVALADGATTSRLEQLKGLVAARPSHGLFREYIDPGTGQKVQTQVLPNATGEDEKDISTPAGARAGARAWAEQNGSRANGNGNGKKG